MGSYLSIWTSSSTTDYSLTKINPRTLSPQDICYIINTSLTLFRIVKYDGQLLIGDDTWNPNDTDLSVHCETYINTSDKYFAYAITHSEHPLPNYILQAKPSICISGTRDVKLTTYTTQAYNVQEGDFMLIYSVIVYVTKNEILDEICTFTYHDILYETRPITYRKGEMMHIMKLEYVE